MAAAKCLLSEDQFLCPICLDLFNEPVSIPCGHNFCKSCISKSWENSSQCQCPMCKKIFNRKPDLQVNVFIAEVAAQFRQATQQEATSSSSDKLKVPCDMCAGPKLTALKSCLVCLASYCDTHLEAHRTVASLKRHQLVDAVENLEHRLCKKHQKPLELFCKDEQVCVCLLCTVENHKTHTVVTLHEANKGMKVEVVKAKTKVHQMIQERRQKIDKLRRSVDVSNKAAEQEKAGGALVFTTVRQAVDRSLNQVNNTVEKKKRATEDKAEGYVTELEEEITKLLERDTELEKLLSSEDELNFLQNCPSGKTALPSRDWTKVNVVPPLYAGTVRKILDKGLKEVEESLSEEMKRQLEAELKTLQQYKVDVILDPNTAHPSLTLSNNGRKVGVSKARKHLPDNPERFTWWFNVLGKQSFSSSPFYFEVQVKGKNEWYVGVARESMIRKENVSLSPINGFWILWLRKGNYKASADPTVLLSLKSKPVTVGVFVDYEDGLVSFYNVNTPALIYSFTNCRFTERIYPLFNPGSNERGNYDRLIINPDSLN